MAQWVCHMDSHVFGGIDLVWDTTVAVTGKKIFVDAVSMAR